jgi:Holliday junction resolvase RusA-like endonuclease
MFEFTVYTEKIMGKARPRFANGRVYTPATTQSYEKMIARRYRECNGPHFGETYLKMEVIACFPIPKSASKANRELMLQGKIRPGKPDGDNLIKAIADSLNQISYDDDKQISTMIITKKYSEDPRLIIRLSEDIDFDSEAV